MLQNQVPLKQSSPAKFIINLSIQNFIPFLGPPFSPQNWGISKKRRDWNWAEPCRALPVKKPLCVPCFLFVEKGFSLLGLTWVPKSKHKQILIKEVREYRNKGKVVKQEK